MVGERSEVQVGCVRLCALPDGRVFGGRLLIEIAAALVVAVGYAKDPVATTVVDVEDPAVFPLKDIRAGQKGISHTVFSSRAGPESFGFEVLGVMRGYLGPGEDLIIAKLTGENIERTGVISGMSGSPAYIDGKLVGAIGYRFGQFTKDAIAGITPIERMKTAAAAPTSTAVKGRALADSPWGRAEPIATPIVTAGLSPVVAAAFADELAARGYDRLVAGGASTSTSTSAPQTPVRFYASGPIAGLLVDGDLSMSGIGTVTWVKGDRFLAFGHPFLGLGKSEMPVSNAEIVVTVASDAGSWKMGQATAPAGRLTDDRLHAIAGTLGELPKTVPVSVRFDLPSPRRSADAQTTSRFSVVRHPTDTPLFSAIAIANALQNRIAVDGGGTFDVTIAAKLSTGDTARVVRRFADKDADAALPTAFSVLGLLSRLTGSEFQDVALEAVDVEVKGRADVDAARVVAVHAVGHARPGQAASALVRLQPLFGAATTKTVSFVVPRGLAPGAYSLVVADDAAAARTEREGGLVAVPQSYADELALLRQAPPPGSLSLYLVKDDLGPRLGGRSAAGLPDSLKDLVSGAGGALGGGVYDSVAVRVARDVSAGVVVGEAVARFVVDDVDAR